MSTTINQNIIFQVMIGFTLLIICVKIFKTKKEGFRDTVATFKRGIMYDAYYAEKYNQIHVSDFDEAVVDLILENTRIDENTLMLDVGCGTGNLMQSFITKGIPIQGIDSSKEMIRKAEKSKIGPISHENVHLSKIIYEESFFTHLLLLGENTANEIITEEFLQNARYWLKTGGKGFLIIHDPQNTAFRGKSTWSPFKKNDRENKTLDFSNLKYQEKENNEIFFIDKDMNETRLYEKQQSQFPFVSPERFGFKLHFKDEKQALEIYQTK